MSGEREDITPDKFEKFLRGREEGEFPPSLVSVRAFEIAKALPSSDYACMAKGGAHLGCIETPGLVESIWSPFGGSYRYVLTPLGKEVYRAAKPAPHQSTGGAA